MRTIPLTLCLLITTLCGCAVGPDFEQPKPPSSTAYDPQGLPKETVSAGQEGAQLIKSGADIPGDWWTLFRSPSLNTLIAVAVSHNPDLEAAEASLRAAQATSDSVSSELFPSLSGSYSVEREKTTGATAGGKFPGSIFTFHNAGLTLSYGLDVFGGTRRYLEESAAQRDFQEFEVKAAYVTLTSTVVATVIAEASLRAQQDATLDIISHEAKELEILKQQLDMGAVSRSSVIAQETVLEQTKTTLPSLNQQLKQTRHQLSMLLGLPPDHEPTTTFSLTTLHLPGEVPLTLPVQLIDQRPDIKASEATLHAASAAIGVAVAKRLPGIDLSGQLGTQANKIDKLFIPGSGVWNIGGSVTESLFDAGALEDQEDAARAEYDAAAALYRKTVLNALREVADVLTALQSDAEAQQAEEKAYNLADESLSLTDEQYKAGAVNYLALLSAEQAKEQSELELIRSKARRFADTAALYQALGGGWWNITKKSQSTHDEAINQPEELKP